MVLQRRKNVVCQLAILASHKFNRLQVFKIEWLDSVSWVLHQLATFISTNILGISLGCWRGLIVRFEQWKQIPEKINLVRLIRISSYELIFLCLLLDGLGGSLTNNIIICIHMISNRTRAFLIDRQYLRSLNDLCWIISLILVVLVQFIFVFLVILSQVGIGALFLIFNLISRFLVVF